ncbi:hypothetical protein WR25_21255 [Diploscapter pachys]|uniref:peroxidase n=1 Tax=Diploscapter pachys TaxID=2018661 RepID=A0A2A2JDR5_9BILA|nr:hypothetical protein WR25_21255 [Diploscapter pachys]
MREKLHRINLTPLNTALYTIWMRQHNNIARSLKKINSGWNDDRLFEESRRIVIAQIQHITYNEFIPALIGKSQLKTRGLVLRNTGYDSSFDMKLIHQTFNVFASTLGWIFFGLYPNVIDLNFNGQHPFNMIYENPSLVQSSRKFQALIDFLASSPILSPGLHIQQNVNNLFGDKNHNLTIFEYVIQLSRYNRIPSYGKWREYCNLPQAIAFQDTSHFRPDVNIETLSSFYESPSDMDLLIGLLAESPEIGSLYGPTFGCIFSEQMKNVKTGDRFWYENFVGSSAFNEKQLMEIRKTKMSKILCDNAILHTMQPNVFRLPNKFELGIEQYRRLEEAEGRKQRENNLVDDHSGALVVHSRLLAPKSESLQLNRRASILREATSIILNENRKDLPNDLSIETLKELLPTIEVDSVIGNFTPYLGWNPLPVDECLKRRLPCDHTSPYRSYSGWCNNLKFPHYGNSFNPMRRLMPPSYDDGFDKARSKSTSGQPLRSPRAISNAVHSESPAVHVHYTHMLMQFGQILDHDMMHSPISRGANNTILNCTRCDSPNTVSMHCMPIEIEKDDPFFPPFHSDGTPRCINFARSLIAQLTLGYRNQLNQLTAFLDASYIYGSSECESNRLRLFRGGALNFTNLGCFMAGDERSNEQPGLTVLHNILLREHNRIAAELQRLNPYWTDEKIFQTTRRIHIAQLQHIVFAEFLPIILGYETMRKYELIPKTIGYFEGYDENCDASISQEMATSAFRFGHTLIRSDFPRMDKSMKITNDSLLLQNHFSDPSPLYENESGHLETLLMGLLGSHSMEFDRHITDAVRNHLFAKPGGPFTGIDLPAVNIQRGRDHGVAPYNQYRELCGLRKAKNFDDLRGSMESSAIEALKTVYTHVDDIDLFTGMMSEKPIQGALVGPTIACVIGEQMQRLKKCDRFYYENNKEFTRFTQDQLAEIRKVALSSVICKNSEYSKHIQPNAFILPDEFRTLGDLVDASKCPPLFAHSDGIHAHAFHFHTIAYFGSLLLDSVFGHLV